MMTIANMWNLSKVVTCLPISIYAADSFETSTRKGVFGFLEPNKKGGVTSATLCHDELRQNSAFGQPFGSMPSFCKRWRHASFTQELNLPCPAAFSICPNSSSSKRIVRRVLLLRSYGFLLLSACIGSNHYVNLLVNGMNHSKRGLTKKQRPAVLVTLAGRLTTTLTGVTP